MVVFCVVDLTLAPTFLLGDSLEVYVRREDAQRFVAVEARWQWSPRSP